MPPDDPAGLAGFPLVPKEKTPDRLYRVHRVDRDPEWFAGGDALDGWRWDPPVGSPEAFGTCYTATDPLGACLETFGAFPIISQSDVDRRSLATIQLPPEPRWADMTNPAILAWQLDERICVGDDYDTCRAWAQQLFAAGFTGVYYHPRHDVARSVSASVALFGDPGHQPGLLRVLRREPISGDLITYLTEVCSLRVLPDVALPPSFDPLSEDELDE